MDINNLENKVGNAVNSNENSNEEPKVSIPIRGASN